MTSTSRITIALAILLTLSAAPAAEFALVGSWSIRDDEILPTKIVFGEQGKLAIKAPGVVIRATCGYTFDDAGSPIELSIHCEPQLDKIEGRFWVTVVSDSVLHVRSDQLNSTVWSDGLLADTWLDRVDDD